MPNSKYEAPGWDQVYDMLLDLAARVRESDYRPEVIVGVSRGGWPPARVMSDLLQNSNLANIKVEFYKDIGVRAEKPRITQPVTSNVVGKRVLVVDDVSDTGHSLRVVVNHLRRNRVRDLKVCALYLKPKSVFKPDFFANVTRKWVIFPWERLEAVQLIARRVKSASGVVRELRGSGMSGRLVRKLFRMISDAGRD